MSVLSKERLTETIDAYSQCNDKNCKLSYCDRECEHYQRMVDKLAKYESLAEQGLLLRVPIAIGTKVYSVLEEDFQKTPYKIYEFEVEDVSLKSFYCDYEWWKFDDNDFCFSRAEAEEKLRELEGK